MLTSFDVEELTISTPECSSFNHHFIGADCTLSPLMSKVANISAWNYPYFTSSNVFAAALVTGNSVLYKPSEHASLSGQEITRLLYEVRCA